MKYRRVSPSCCRLSQNVTERGLFLNVAYKNPSSSEMFRESSLSKILDHTEGDILQVFILNPKEQMKQGKKTTNDW